MGAKFGIAAIRPTVLRRQRLFDRLTEGIEGPLTLVSAHAGSGKTVLVSSWVLAGAAPRPMTWITLDEGDERSGIFWAYVLEGLARNGITTAGVGAPRSVEAVGRSFLVRLAAVLSDQPRPVVLVLDNAERLANRRLADEVDFVLTHSAGRLRMVVLTRIDPALPLHKYRLRGAATELRFPDLSFTSAEAEALLANDGVSLPEGGVRALVEHTRGWAAGLRFAGITFGHQAGDRSDTGALTGLLALTGDEVAAYFRKEVLAPQRDEVRDFLLRTSVVDRLWPGLAAHLSGGRDAGRRLRDLAEARTFLEAEPGPGEVYRYSPLVRRLLLSQQSVAQRRRLHRKAAHWLVSTGRTVDAIEQYAAAGDWGDATRLLVRDLSVASLLLAAPGDRLTSAVHGLPRKGVSMEATVVTAGLALAGGDAESAARGLAELRNQPLGAPGEDTAALRLSTELVAAELGARSLDPVTTRVAVAAAEVACEDLAGAGRRVPEQVPALLGWSTGNAELGAGDFSAAKERFLAVAKNCRGVTGCQRLRIASFARLALTEAVAGRLGRAHEYAQRAVAVDERTAAGERSRLGSIDAALAWANAEQMDVRRAMAHVEAAQSLDPALLDGLCLGVLALVRSRALRARGDLSGALSVLARARAAAAGTGMRSAPAWLAHRLYAAEASIFLAQGRQEEARAVARMISSSDSVEGMLVRAGLVLAAGRPAEASRIAELVLDRVGLPVDQRVEALLLAAAGELDQSRTGAARALLDQARKLAQPERLRRPFMETTGRLRAFLRENHGLVSWGAQTRNAAGTVWGGTLGEGLGPVQPLTERELEVLANLAALLRTEEIAAKMFVSVNTVKTHIRSILRKLAVDRRNDAVRKARELGLL